MLQRRFRTLCRRWEPPTKIMAGTTLCRASFLLFCPLVGPSLTRSASLAKNGVQGKKRSVFPPGSEGSIEGKRCRVPSMGGRREGTSRPVVAASRGKETVEPIPKPRGDGRESASGEDAAIKRRPTRQAL